jgi:hypothetical protein
VVASKDAATKPKGRLSLSMAKTCRRSTIRNAIKKAGFIISLREEMFNWGSLISHPISVSFMS